MRRMLYFGIGVTVILGTGCSSQSSQIDPGTRAALINGYLQKPAVSQQVPVYQMPVQRPTTTNCREVAQGQWSCQQY